MSAPHTESEGMGAVGKAILVGFLILILANGNLSGPMQFAVLGAIITYFVVTKGAKSEGGAH